MQHPRLVLTLAFVIAVAACSANEPSPPLVEPPRAPSATAPAAPTAPSIPTTAPASTIPPIQLPAPKSLKSAMKGIEEDWKQIEARLAANPVGDLATLAAEAKRVAAVMKLAYDPFEDKEVPNFGKFAREAESALLELAAKASAGDADAVKTLGKTLQPQHCARCHDAVEEVHG